MNEELPFLIRLGLRTDTDAREVRRAYARELKLIDQATQAGSFQELRDAYETALAWLAHRAAQDAADNTQVPAAPAPVDAPAPSMADRLSLEVYDLFTASCAALQKSKQARDQLQWEALLREHLALDQLLNISARTMFEARLAHTLAQGWQTGHELLLPAAANVFDWHGDGRRLAQFGYAGATINHAIDQSNIFTTLPAETLQHGRNLITRLRSARPPTPEFLAQDLPFIEQLADRFPALFGLTTNMANLERWRAQHEQALVDAKNHKPVSTRVPWTTDEKVWTVAGSLFALVIVSGFFVERKDVPYTAYQTSTRDWNEPVEPKSREAPFDTYRPNDVLNPGLGPVPAPAPQRTKVYNKPAISQAMIDDIGSKIRYFPPPYADARTLTTEWQGAYDGAGKLTQLKKLSGSGDQSYDDAVGRAIMGYRNFPVADPLNFTLRYSIKITRGIKENKPTTAADKLRGDSQKEKSIETVPPTETL